MAYDESPFYTDGLKPHGRSDDPAPRYRRLSVAVGTAGNVRVEVSAAASWPELVADLWAGVEAVKSDDAERREAMGIPAGNGSRRPSAAALAVSSERE